MAEKQQEQEKAKSGASLDAESKLKLAQLIADPSVDQATRLNLLKLIALDSTVNEDVPEYLEQFLKDPVKNGKILENITAQGTDVVFFDDAEKFVVVTKENIKNVLKVLKQERRYTDALKVINRNAGWLPNAGNFISNICISVLKAGEVLPDEATLSNPDLWYFASGLGIPKQISQVDMTKSYEYEMFLDNLSVKKHLTKNHVYYPFTLTLVYNNGFMTQALLKTRSSEIVEFQEGKIPNDYWEGITLDEGTYHFLQYLSNEYPQINVILDNVNIMKDQDSSLPLLSNEGASELLSKL